MKRWFVAFTLAALAWPETRAEERSALIVEQVASDSVAAKAGLASGDGVVSYNGQPLPSPAALQALEENTFDTTHVTLAVRRGAQTLMLQVPHGSLTKMQARPALPAVAQTLYEEGRTAQATDRADIAVSRWTAAARAARDAGELAAAAWLFGRVGEIREGRREWTDASAAHAEAWTLLKDAADVAAKSRALVALGRCSENANEFATAQQWYEQAAQVDVAAGYEVWAAGDATRLGVIAYTRGDLAAAQNHLARALLIAERRVPDSLHVALNLHHLGFVASLRGDLATAQDHHTRALSIRERVDAGSLEVAASLNRLGDIARRRGDFSAAHDYFSRALAIREREAPGSLDHAASLHNLGIIHGDRGDVEAEETLLMRSMAIIEDIAPGSLDMAIRLQNVGRLAWKRGDLARAQDFLGRSLAIRERLAPDAAALATVLTNLGLVARSRGDLAAAQEHHSRALAIRERLAPGSRGVASVLNNLGVVARDRRDPITAHQYHARALAIVERLAPDSPDVAETLTALGMVAQSQDNVAAAERHHRRALTIRRKLSDGSLLMAENLEGLGIAAGSRGDLAAAGDHHRGALAIRERVAPSSLDEASSLNHLGGLARAEGRLSDALVLFSRAVDIIEAQRSRIGSTESRALLLARHAESYEGLLRTQIGLGDVAAAFATAERSRARSLLEILGEARAEIRQGVDPVLLNDERLLQQRINDKAARQVQVLGGRHTPEEAARVRRELDALLVQYRDVQAHIRTTSPRYAALTQPQPRGLSEIQRDVLDEQTVLLEYVLGEESSFLFAVTPTSIRSFALPARAQVEQAARRVYDALIARQPSPGEAPSQRRIRIDQADADYPDAAAALTRMVLEPVAEQLSGQRLLIVADGALQYVPFAALPRPKQPAHADAEPLVVQHEIVSLPSASIVSVLRSERVGRQPAERAVAVLADPVFDAKDSRVTRRRKSEPPAPVAASLSVETTRAARAAGLADERGGLARLPFTRDEADAIVALAPKGEGTRAVDFDASRSTVTSPDLGRYRIVHLATHGLLDTERPELSGIVLSLFDEQGRPQDGFLRLHEVYNLNWSADLVVLSACQTALGKEIRGEGLVGLTRGFMYGGAERVMASLWSVNDSVTAQFMKRFYGGLFGKGLSPAAALRAAQVDMWRRPAWRSSYYWAAFVLQGEWR